MTMENRILPAAEEGQQKDEFGSKVPSAELCRRIGVLPDFCDLREMKVWSALVEAESTLSQIRQVLEKFKVLEELGSVGIEILPLKDGMLTAEFTVKMCADEKTEFETKKLFLSLRNAYPELIALAEGKEK